MLSPLWLMWKVRCGKAGYFAAGLVASEQGRRPGLGRICVGPSPWAFVALVRVAPDRSGWRRLLAQSAGLGEEAAGAECRARGVWRAVLCSSAAGSSLAIPTGDKPDRCDLSLESNLNTWF